MSAVHGLPAKWRNEVPQASDDQGDAGEAMALERCADELEAALRQSGEAVIYYVANVERGGDFNHIPISMFDQPAIFISREKAEQFSAFANGTGSKHEVRSLALPAISIPPATSGLVEAAGLVADLASTEWQEPDGSRKGATDNFGKRMYFVSAELIDGLRAALAAHDKRGAA